MCKGQCPGTAIDGDWRNRTEHCDVWKAAFARLEAELIAEGRAPISMSPERSRIEQAFLEHWGRGKSIYMSQIVGPAR